MTKFISAGIVAVYPWFPVKPRQLSRLAARHLNGVLHGFGQAAGASFRSTVIENGKQLSAATGRRHALPSLLGAGVTREGQLDQRRQFTLGFHGFKQKLGHLCGAPDAE